MPYALLAEYLRLPLFLLVASRLGGILMFMPVLGALALPPQLRALLVVALAAVVTPLVDAPAGWPDTLGGLALAMGGELLIGVLMGLAVFLCFVGLQLGAQLIAQESGLALGQILDPMMEEEDTVLGSLYLQLGLVIFLIIGGHRVLLAAAFDSFRTVPLLSGMGWLEGGGAVLLDALRTGGELAIRIAAPTVLTLFLVNLGLGFVSRTVPQLNVTTLGFSFKALLGFALMAISLPVLLAGFTETLEAVIGQLRDLMG